MVAAWLIERLRTQLQQEHWAAEAGRRQREHLAGLRRQGLRHERQVRGDAAAQLARPQLENLELRQAALRPAAGARQPGHHASSRSARRASWPASSRGPASMVP